ncbi:MAG: hypothetical protein JW764_02830 [Chlorobiaceae bacterium]|nr:hypothetical protein [Chlorobiaceae bacterium]
MDVLKRAGSSLTGFAGKAQELFGGKHHDGMGGYEFAGVDVLGERSPFGAFETEPVRRLSRGASSAVFDLGALLRLRSFLYLLAVTGLFLFQISNTLAINDLSRRNERLREELRIGTSISTAQEMKTREMQSIRYITAYARQLGLESSPVPPVELKP